MAHSEEPSRSRRLCAPWPPRPLSLPAGRALANVAETYRNTTGTIGNERHNRQQVGVAPCVWFLTGVMRGRELPA